MLKNETVAEVEQARKEIQWDSEKRNVALHKLYGFFLNPLEANFLHSQVPLPPFFLSFFGLF
jgi:hypothetical protein